MRGEKARGDAAPGFLRSEREWPIAREIEDSPLHARKQRRRAGDPPTRRIDPTHTIEPLVVHRPRPT
jgi:hypothetical protein